MTDPLYRSELNGPSPSRHPMTWLGATRKCGKCGARLPIAGTVGGKVHRILGWMCPKCSASTNMKDSK